MTRNTLQLNAFLAILLLVGSLVVLNLLSWEYLGTDRADLTDSQRWRIADVTRDVLGEMQKRYDDLVAAAGDGATEEDKQALRLRIDFYVSQDPPATVVDRFLEAGDRLRDVEELAGDFLVLTRKELVPGKTVSEIEEAEEYHLAKISELDELGKPLDLYCGLVVHWGEETKVLHNAMPPVDVESWLVRTMSTFIDTDPAKVWVLAPYELQGARLTRDGQAQLRGFVEDLRDWIQSQNIQDMQEVQRLATTYRPKILRNDLRRLFPRAAIVKMVTRIEEYDPIPDDCSLLVLMQPNADVMSEEAMRQISRYLANGGTVVALAPRYEVSPGGQQQAQQLVGATIDLGEFGNYLESLGVTVRPEVVAQLPCYTMTDEAQVASRGTTTGRREALQARFPFWPRLDARDRSALENPLGLQVFLLQSILDAVKFHAEFLDEYRAVKDPKALEILNKTLADAQVTLQGWADVWRDRNLSDIEGELGRWHYEDSRQRLALLGKAIDSLDEQLETVEDDLDVYRRDLRDLEARERAELADWLGLDPDQRRDMSDDELQSWFADARRRARDAGSSDAVRAWKDISVQVAKRAASIAEKESELQLLEHVISRTRKLERSMALARRGFLAWYDYASNQSNDTPIHRRMFLQDVTAVLDALRARQPLEGGLAKFAADMLRDFELLLAFDAYVGDPAAVVKGIAWTMRELKLDDVPTEVEGAPLLRGPGSLTDGLNHAYLMWPNPVQLDPDKVDVRDGDETTERTHDLLATVIARASSTALYARDPNPLGSMEVIQRAQGASAFESAMLREASSPQKANDDLPGGLPLVVAIEGAFPQFGKEIERRPIVDTLRQVTAPLLFGGPVAFEGDTDAAPEFDAEKGWQREGLATWSLADFAETVRQLRDEKEDSNKKTDTSTETGDKTGRMLVVGNLGFAMDSVSGGGGQGGNIELGLLYHEATSPGINGVPLVRRIFEWALRGNRFEEFDRRQTTQPRKLTNFRNELLRESVPVRAANVYKAALTNAASATTFLEDAGRSPEDDGGFGLGAVREDPVQKALARIVDGVDTELEQREGLDQVINGYEEDISKEADVKEKDYELWGWLFAPVLLLGLLLGSLLFTWVRYR